MTAGTIPRKVFWGAGRARKSKESDAPDAPRTTDACRRPTNPAYPGGARTTPRSTPRPSQDPGKPPHPNSISQVRRRSIDHAATDVRAFLSPGVPKELARAALRRAWSADPAIRDSWAWRRMPGTSPIPRRWRGSATPPDYDVKKLVAQIFGDGEKPADPGAAANELADPQASQASHIAEEIAAPSPAEAGASTSGEGSPCPPNISSDEQQIAQNDFVQRDNNVALHNSDVDGDTEEPANRRQHGGALPQ